MTGDDSVPIRILLVTVFNSIIEVFILCLAGYVLSRAGVTDKATQRKLNVINVSLFTPALLFSKVAYSLTPSKLKEMWIIPLGFVVVTGLSAAVAWVLSSLFKLKRSQTAFAICAAMFQNSNSLPIALIQSLVIEVPGLKWGADDSKDQMLGRALTYLVLYSTLGMMLLSRADDEDEEQSEAPPVSHHIATAQDRRVMSPEPLDTVPEGGETNPFFSSEERSNTRHTTSSFGVAPTTIRDPSPSPTLPFTAPGSAHSMQAPLAQRRGTDSSFMSRRESALSTRRQPTRTESGREFWGLPEQPKRRGISLIEEDSSDDEEDDEEWGDLTPPSLRRRGREPPQTRLKSMMRKVQNKATAIGKSVNAFMTVPMYAALLSIFIAMIPPLQRQMARVTPLEQAIKSAGQCSIPVTLVVLGAFFYAPPQNPPLPPQPTLQSESPMSGSNHTVGGYFERKFRALAGPSGSSAYPKENRTVFVAVVSRMIITPLLMLPLLATIAKYDLFEAAEDPVFILSAVLLVSSPPALTLAQITQAASGDAFERLISKTISWSYAILTPPLTLVYVVIGLVFGRL
ncbi:hypothetical protein IAR55_005753 [Kwoniella newhampshirensis]|uniref:Endoplasmic reticulum protein n=1 Tax=Kwoniella newhampshirensis TaxID=1651941 RepID=A0AAW0YYF4_9TREE